MKSFYFSRCPLLHVLGISRGSISTNIWNSVPPKVIDRLTENVANAENSLIQKWYQFSNEETMTGALFSRVDDSLSVNNYNIKFRFLESSKQTKESETGTDVTLILHVNNSDGSHGIKTLWFQAKKNKNIPSTPHELYKLPRMKSQMEKMYKITNDSYGIIYSPDNVKVMHKNWDKPISLADLIYKSLKCEYGDQSISTFSKSLNRSKTGILEIVKIDQNFGNADILRQHF